MTLLPTAYGLNRYGLFSDSCGIRTQPDWLERPVTSPEFERAMLFSQFCQRVPSTQLFIRSFCLSRLRLLPMHHSEWTGRCSNPPLRFFRPPHDQRCASVPASQLPVHLLNKTLGIGTKKPGVAQGDTGLTNVVRRLQSAECHLRLGCPKSKLHEDIFAFCNTMPLLQF